MSLIVHPYCTICGDPVDGKTGREYTCSWCVEKRPGFDAARSAVRYRGPTKDAVQALKYKKITCVAADLGLLLISCVRTHFDSVRFDMIVSVPLYGAREWKRTFNQSRLLAMRVSRGIGVSYFGGGLRRTRATDSQTGLRAAQRSVNVKGAFSVPEPAWIEGKRILLVDDVMTTGATVNECSRVLKQAGAASVHVATVARG